MTSLFPQIVKMSITASILVLAVILLRFALKRAPRWMICLLWGFVALRLILPFSIESSFSLIPTEDHITINTGAPSFNEPATGDLTPDTAPDPGYSETPNISVTPRPSDPQISLQKDPLGAMDILALVWLTGIGAMLIYTCVSFMRIRRKVRESLVLDGNVCICDHIPTPFILGVFKPRIYLPYSINESDREYVLSHERAHIRRGDHLIKPLGFLLLSVYWFNPVIWLAYILLCRDIEIACDEKVIKKLGCDVKRSYSEALVNCSLSRKLISACPLAFGEIGVKERVKNVLNYKKPTFWIIIIAVVALSVTAVCFLTDPKPPYTVQYFETISFEGSEPKVAQTISVPAYKLAPMLEQIKEQEWICESLVGQKIPFYFDGMIKVGEYDIYFGFTSQILYCDYQVGYFTSLTEDHAKLLKDELKNNGIESDIKLDIYVCQFAKGSYNFTLYESGSFGYPDLYNTPYTDIEYIRLLISIYGLTKEDINIIPWTHWASSYLVDMYPDPEKYIQTVKEFILSDITPSDVYDRIYHDIDGDGKAEELVLRGSSEYVALVASDDSIPKYTATHNKISNYKSAKFAEHNGKPYIKILFNNDAELSFGIKFSNGNISITDESVYENPSDAIVKLLSFEENSELLDEFLAVLEETETSNNSNFLSNWKNYAPKEVRKLGFGFFMQPHGNGRIYYNGKIYKGPTGYVGGPEQLAVADINRDGAPEIYYIYSRGSGNVVFGLAYFDSFSEETVDLGGVGSKCVVRLETDGDSLYCVSYPSTGANSSEIVYINGRIVLK